MRQVSGLWALLGVVGACGWLGCAEAPESQTSPSSIDPSGEETITQTSQGLTCTKLRRGSGASVSDAVIAMDPLDPTRAGANLGTGIILNAGAFATTSYQSLLRFDLTSLPASANVSSATLTLNKYTNLGVGTVNLHRVLAPWSESTVTWSAFNGAFSSAIDGSISSSVPNGPVSLDLTPAVQAWLSGAQSNEGILLAQPNGGRTSFGASDASFLAARPYLTVCYTLTPTCSDGVQNGLETGVDCGGACPACPSCVPSAELCNGLDDDCDGQVDEGNPGGGAACSTGLPGVCSAGTTACAGGAIACSQLVGASVESCNGLDDDCDGAVDQGNPGGGVACSTGLLGACAAGATVCSSGGIACTQTTSPVSETCNGADDDCNGQVDELGTTSCGVGACAATVTACVGGSLSTCTPGSPSAELCDGLFDEDCDGVVDDGCACLDGTVQSCYGGAPGTLGVGLCGAGTQTCVAGQWAACTGEVVPSAESCNGQDDDCDGAIDQGNPQGGASCSTGALGACAAGTVTCAAGALGCQALASPQPESCNGVDDDCDGATDEGVTTAFYQDADGDGAGNASVSVQACVAPAGYGTDASDCNDASATVFPGAQESCNGADDDCDGATDEGVTTTFYADVDGDGFGSGAVTTQACSVPSGFVANASDCNDGAASVQPGAAESCNGVDDDCDGATDEGYPGSGASCTTGAHGVCAAGTTTCVAGALACSQTLQATTEVCDGLDNDCDGQTDEGNPGGGSACATGLSGVCSSGVRACMGGSLVCLQSLQPSAEICDGLDGDCDGVVDDGVTTTYWQDADGDGFGNGAIPVAACAQPAGYVTNSSDCNDTKFFVKPGGVEVCNGLDDDCNGQVDELVTFTYYLDGDGDGYGTAVTTQACTVPAGYASLTGDCNDANANVNPGKAEVCNFADDNCSGTTDEGDPGGGAQCATGLPGACSTGTYHCLAGAVTCVQDTSQTWYLDSDDDGYGVTGSKKTQCTQPVGYAALPNDCDDADEEINPGAVEVCNVVDDNCDNLVDNNVPSPTIWYFDGDGDGYGASPTAAQCTQPVGYSPSGGDCNDSLASVSPAAAEACNGLDDNCNTVVDEGNPDSGASCTTVYPGVCAAGTTACFQGVLICNQINASGSEVCNGLDDDCDGSADENNVCVCATGQTQSCYTGPAGTLGVGICAAGTQTCTAGVWGACQNQVQPGVENCALAPDEDCNGTAPSCSGSTLWAQKFGGTSSDLAYGIAVDGAGNTYITGYFQGTVNFGAGSVTSAGSYDVFLAKLNSAGAYVWSKTFGGASPDIGYDVAVDASGNVFLSGSSRSTTLNLGGSNLPNAGSTSYYDAFLAKYDSNGTHQWSKRFGGTAHDHGYALETDKAGNVVLAGYFSSTSGLNFGGSSFGTAGSYDPYVAKFDTNGTHLWSNKWGGSSADYGYDVAIGPSNEVILVGGYASSAMNFGGGTLATTGGYDAYVLKLDQNGNYVFAKKFGDADTQYGYSVAVDGSGNILFTGIAQGGIDFGGGNITASATYYDMYAAKLNPSGGHIWGKTFGASSTHDYAWGCAFDPSGNAVVSGYFQGSVNFGGSTLTSAGSYDLAIIKLNTAGSHVYSKSFGNASAQYGRRVKTDASGNALWVGYFAGSVDFGLGTLTSAGSNDIFVSKLAP
jgi:hypothetical protein